MNQDGHSSDLSGQAAGRCVAAFDFDGTLTNGDTSLPFIEWVVGRRAMWAALVRSVPGAVTDAVSAVAMERDARGSVVGFGGRVIGRVEGRAHERIVTACFAGRPLERVLLAGEEFGRERLGRFLRPDRLEIVRRHRAAGHRCVLVTGSLDVYLTGWARRAGFDDVIGTELEVSGNGLLTGRFAGPPCWGPEKVARLESLVGPLDSQTLYAYGNGTGDRDLMAAADHPVWCT